MRALTTSLILASLLGVAAEPAFANHDQFAGLVDSWYHRYLGRHAEPQGLAGHVWMLQTGTPVEVVEAGILASPEYFLRNGNNDHAFIIALFRDLGVGLHPSQVHQYCVRLQQLGGCRDNFVLEVMRQVRSGVVAPAPVVPAPAVVETYRPVYAAPVVPASVYVRPAYRPAYPAYPIRPYDAGHYYYGQPGVSFGISVRR